MSLRGRLCRMLDCAPDAVDVSDLNDRITDLEEMVANCSARHAERVRELHDVQSAFDDCVSVSKEWKLTADGYRDDLQMCDDSLSTSVLRLADCQTEKAALQAQLDALSETSDEPAPPSIPDEIDLPPIEPSDPDDAVEVILQHHGDLLAVFSRPTGMTGPLRVRMTLGGSPSYRFTL